MLFIENFIGYAWVIGLGCVIIVSSIHLLKEMKSTTITFMRKKGVFKKTKEHDKIEN